MLKATIILIGAVAAVYGGAASENDLDGRIVGGRDTTIDMYPWQVSLQRVSGSHFCGGSLYTDTIVITAAHCVPGLKPEDLKVRVGSTFYNTGGELLNVSSVVSHEGYSRDHRMNDIALLRLATPVTLSKRVKTIKLATKAPTPRANAAVTGWGTTTSGGGALPQTLQAVFVKMVSKADCSSDTYGYGDLIKDTMICAYAQGKDSCQGDSGGPLVSGGHLVGVVSWGKGCAFPDYPGVYADVAHLNPWIVKTANELLTS